jgi:hypothetical protein
VVKVRHSRKMGRKPSAGASDAAVASRGMGARLRAVVSGAIGMRLVPAGSASPASSQAQASDSAPIRSAPEGRPFPNRRIERMA